MSTHAIDVPYFFARPSGARPGGPGIIVAMEGSGMSQQLLRVAQRLAHVGYTVIAPDLFHHFGGSDADAALAAGGWGSKIDEATTLADLRAAHGELRAMGVGPIGITGFCMGGRVSYLAAVRGLDVACAAPFYGSGIGKLLGPVSCPLLAFYGDRDDYIPNDEIEKVRRFHAGDVVVYPGARHGFFRDGSPEYEPDAANDAWPRLLTFLRNHLGAAES
jgi:carboxymethylenebutenolidase